MNTLIRLIIIQSLGVTVPGDIDSRVTDNANQRRSDMIKMENLVMIRSIFCTLVTIDTNQVVVKDRIEGLGVGVGAGRWGWVGGCEIITWLILNIHDRCIACNNTMLCWTVLYIEHVSILHRNWKLFSGKILIMKALNGIGIFYLCALQYNEAQWRIVASIN